MNVDIVDPTKVVRSVLENAVSGASMILTTEVTVSDYPKKDDSAGLGGMPGGGMGMPGMGM